jgi:pimeloyl-ACP methyl ester carboxylesterase
MTGDNVSINVHYRFANIDGHRIFYPEAGPDDGPVLVLLHGFPSSSYMFRYLVPQLADPSHVGAPDHLGFGLTDSPTAEEFDYTFDALTDLTAKLLA